MSRFDLRFPRSGEDVDVDEFMEWLRLGLDPEHRGHDGAATPIIHANSLMIFASSATPGSIAARHQLPTLEALWTESSRPSQQVESARSGPARPSRFEAVS